MKKPLLILSGFICVLLGTVGIILPILPTTPFFLLAAYFFSKSSSRFYNWLLELPKVGALIESWNRYGTISLKAKITSLSCLILIMGYLLFFKPYETYLKVIIVTILCSVMIFLSSRPSIPNQRKSR